MNTELQRVVQREQLIVVQVRRHVAGRALRLAENKRLTATLGPTDFIGSSRPRMVNFGAGGKSSRFWNVHRVHLAASLQRTDAGFSCSTLRRV